MIESLKIYFYVNNVLYKMQEGDNNRAVANALHFEWKAYALGALWGLQLYQNQICEA